MYTSTITTALCLFGALAAAAPAEAAELGKRQSPITVWTYTDGGCANQNQVYYGQDSISCTSISNVYSFHGGTSGMTCSLMHFSGDDCQGSSTTQTINADSPGCFAATSGTGDGSKSFQVIC